MCIPCSFPTPAVLLVDVSSSESNPSAAISSRGMGGLLLAGGVLHFNPNSG